MEHEALQARLDRLAREREAADRAYNDALTAVDRGMVRDIVLPAPPSAYDESQIAPLNQSASAAAPVQPIGGLRGRLARFIWRVVAPALQKQAAINSLLVDHLNRNIDGERATRAAIASLRDAMRDHLDQVLAFQSRLVVCLQQITPYVDTKDRETAGGALVVNAAVNALAEDAAKRVESLAARERRFVASVDSLKAAQEELRTLIGVSQQATLAIKRELQRVIEPPAHPPFSPDAPRSSRPAAPGTHELKGEPTGVLDAYKYVGFEDQFRGSQDTIRERLRSYVPYFKGAKDVLDVGCGRGEFLELLKAAGVAARGLDLNHEMVEVCRARGLDVAEGDVVTYLDGLPDGSLGGLFAAQVVEHLQPEYLLRFLELAHHKLGPGAPIVLETLNPACWVAFFDSYIRDITHVWPLHPDTLRYLVLASGFISARIEYRSPVAPEDKLQPIAAGGALRADLAETINANVEKLNARMFTYLDYAVIGSRSA
jgi:SAM-dependent methyltransferase